MLVRRQVLRVPIKLVGISTWSVHLDYGAKEATIWLIAAVSSTSAASIRISYLLFLINISRNHYHFFPISVGGVILTISNTTNIKVTNQSFPLVRTSV
jgi:hypothetical protein